MIVRRVLQLIALATPVYLCLAEQAPQAPTLNVLVLQGEGTINNIKRRTTRESIVQVQDENHKPVAGAAILIQLPADGPGGVFPDGSKSITLFSDSQGKVVMPHLQPSQVTGNFQIHVNASFQGRQGVTVINQSIAPGPTGVNPTHAMHGKTIGIVSSVAAAGAIAAALVLRNNNTPPVTVPTGTISAGSGVIGASPH